jgi:hypothetical protein
LTFVHVAARKAPGFAAAAVAILALVLPAAAGAAPTWLGPKTLSPSVINFKPNVAVDTAGNALAVWIGQETGGYAVEASYRPVGGSWSTPIPISSPEQAQYKCEGCLEPQAAFDGSGKAYVVWSYYNTTTGPTPFRQIAMRTRSAAGVWGRFALVLSTTKLYNEHPRLAVSPGGVVGVVWEVYNGSRNVVQGYFRPAAGTFVPVQTISDASQWAYYAEIGMSAGGNALVTFTQSPDGAIPSTVMQLVTRPPAGPWSSPQPISAAGVYENDLAVNAAGDAVGAWSRVDTANVTRVEAAVRPAGSSWSSALPVSPGRAGGSFVQTPQVAVGPNGLAVVAWMAYNGANTIIDAAARGPGAASAWGPGLPISAAGVNASNPDVAVSGAGTAVAVWTRGGSVQSSTRSAAGAWSPAVPISASDSPVYYPEVVADGRGNAVGIWSGSDGTNIHVRAAGLDASGPAFNGLAIPSNGTVGKQLSFAASPFDIWSALGPGPIWSFGDGGSGAGTAVTHAYSKTGTYKVTLTQADAVGNASTASRQLTITAAPAPAGVHCVVPKVVGKALAKAKTALRRRHCRTGKLTRAYSKQIEKGRVLRQKPKARTKLRNGAKVALVVSRGKRPRR